MRIAERTPELLPLAVEDRKTVGIVHRRSKIIEVLAVIWPEKEHAGHRGKAAVSNIHSRIKRHLDVKDGGLAGANGEAITCGRALAVQQGVDDEGSCFRRRLFQPKRLEYGKFFALRLAGVDRETAGGQAIGFSLGDRPEVTCAQEDANLVVIIRPVDRSVNAKPGEA